jgi:hypothetical protein
MKDDYDNGAPPIWDPQQWRLALHETGTTFATWLRLMSVPLDQAAKQQEEAPEPEDDTREVRDQDSSAKLKDSKPQKKDLGVFNHNHGLMCYLQSEVGSGTAERRS